MQKIIWLPLSSALVLILSGCANNGTARNDPLGTGPFDSQGNYHEEWANDPSKWNKPGKRTSHPSGDELPLIAQRDQPPANANPLAPGAGSVSSTPPRVDSVREPAHHTGELKIVSVKPRIPGSRTGTRTGTKTGTKTGTTSKSTASKTKSKSSGSGSTASTKPKSRATDTTSTKPKSSGTGTTASTKPKSHVSDTTSTKPKSSGAGTKTQSKSGSYTVKKGDSLELVARRSGKSVSAIKKANGMSGETIHPGQPLVVPK